MTAMIPTTTPTKHPAPKAARTKNAGDVSAVKPTSPAPPSVQVLEIPWKLPGLNEIIAANASALRMRGKRVSRYTQLKRQWTNVLSQLILVQQIHEIRNGFFRFSWHESNRKRDPDNIAAGGRKFILDALVATRRLPNDGWANVAGWTDSFDVREQAGVTVEIFEGYVFWRGSDYAEFPGVPGRI